MSRLKPWLPLILIVLGLFLSGAKNGRSATPSDNPHAAKVQQAPNDQDAHAFHERAVGRQPGASPTATKSAIYTNSHCYPAPDGWLALFGQIAAIVTAILLTVFTGGLWWTSVRQWRVVLHANRPFLLVSAIKTSDKNLADEPAGVICHNAGTGPADIIEIVADCRLFRVPHDKEFNAAYYPISLTGLEPKRTDFSVIPAAKEGISICTFEISSDYESVIMEQELDDAWTPDVSVLVAYGRIKYRGGPPDVIYETNFFWWYLPLEALIERQGYFSRGPEIFNRRT